MKCPRRSTPFSVRPTSTAGNGSVTMMRRTVGSPVRAAAMRLPASAARSPASTWTRSGSSGIVHGVWHSSRESSNSGHAAADVGHRHPGVGRLRCVPRRSRSARSAAGSATSSTGRRASRSKAWATGTERGAWVLIGVISDTHGLLRPEAVEALRGAEHIIHAGDIGAADVLTALAAIAPVTAVRGNNDGAAWAAHIPQTAVLAAGGTSIYVIHDVNELDLGSVGGWLRRRRGRPFPSTGAEPARRRAVLQSRQRGTAALPPPDLRRAAARRRRRRRRRHQGRADHPRVATATDRRRARAPQPGPGSGASRPGAAASRASRGRPRIPRTGA